MLLLARVMFCFADIGMASIALLSLGYFQYSANILVVSTGIVESVGAVLHPIWEQLPLGYSRQMRLHVALL